MIKPTVGRMVWFWGSVTQGAPRGEFEQPQAATITYVWGDDMVNLSVFSPEGGQYGLTSVPLFQGEGERPFGFFAEWMPYQIGQAKKNEEDSHL